MLVPKEGGVVYYCKSLATVSHSAPSHYGNTLQIVTCMRKVDHVKTNVPYVEWGSRARQQTSNLHDCESVGGKLGIFHALPDLTVRRGGGRGLRLITDAKKVRRKNRALLLLPW